MTRVRFVCAACRSDNVTCMSESSWNPDTQAWETETTFRESGQCHDCDVEGPVISEELNS